jgi:hypothetical protein
MHIDLRCYQDIPRSWRCFLRFFKTLKILYDNLGFTKSKKNFSDLSSHSVKDLGREVNF